MTSPLSRSLAALRDVGWFACVAEHWNPHARVRVDLGGFADGIAFRMDLPPVLAVQACAASGASAHRAKLSGVLAARKWLLPGQRELEVWAWGKHGERGKRKLWTVRRWRAHPGPGGTIDWLDALALWAVHAGDATVPLPTATGEERGP